MCKLFLLILKLIMSLQTATAHFPPERFTKSDDGAADISAERKQIILNSGEELFAEIR
jgi:hypothetical protein